MSRRNLGAIVAAIGLVTTWAFVLADSVGLGRYRGFGADQILGTIAGVVVLVLGVFLASRKRG